MRCIVEYACISDRGLMRSVNQDNFLCNHMISPRACERTDGVLHGQICTSDNALFGVFDGMGGEQAGEDAALIAASTAAEYAVECNADSLRRICCEANRKIIDFSMEHWLESCGSTAAMLCLKNDSLYACNLGDSRVYQVLPDELAQLSEDHVIAVPGRKKPVLTRYLGMSDSSQPPEPHLTRTSVKCGDCFLICSDGLTDMVSEQEIACIVTRSPQLPDAAQALLDAALAAGGRDNTTLILVRVISCQHRLWSFIPFHKPAPHQRL